MTARCFLSALSTFVLDEFKRKYSNEDTLSVALPYFWEHFDKDGWSLWYAEYRFPEELTQTFMSCNLITGEEGGPGRGQGGQGLRGASLTSLPLQECSSGWTS